MRGQSYWQTILVSLSSPAGVARLEAVVVEVVDVDVNAVAVEVAIVNLIFGSSVLNLFSFVAGTLTRRCMQRICLVKLGSFRHLLIRAISEIQAIIIDTAHELG